MKTIFVFLFLIFSAACAANSVESQKIAQEENSRTENQKTKTETQFTKQPVLVELYTSEG